MLSLPRLSGYAFARLEVERAGGSGHCRSGDGVELPLPSLVQMVWCRAAGMSTVTGVAASRPCRLPVVDASAGWIAFVNVETDLGSIDYYAASTVFRFLNFVLRAEIDEQGWPRSREYVLERDPDLQRVPESLAPWRAT